MSIQNNPNSTAGSGLPNLTVDTLVSLTMSEAWQLCGEDAATFQRLAGKIADDVAKYRRIPQATVDAVREQIAEAALRMLAVDGDHRIALFVNAAVMKSLHREPMAADTVAAYNAGRTCNDKSTVCHAPSTSLYFGRDGSVTACCYSRSNSLGSWPLQSISEIWLDAKIKSMREELRLNILPSGCDTCAEQLSAHNFKGFLGGNFDSFVPSPTTDSSFGQTAAVVYPIRMEFELSNKCNLECAMCSGQFSSSIRANRENKAPLPQVYDSRFVEQLKEFIPHLKQAKFLGGEPFLIDIYYEIWELFIQLNPSCEIIITTNGTVFTNKVQRVLEHLNCQIVVSLDSVEKATYESIRVNATMERTLEHVDKFMALNKEHSKPLSIAVCPMPKNWREIPGLVNFANTRGIAMFFNTVTFPPDESLKFMPVVEQLRVLEGFRGALGTAKTPIEAGNYRALKDLCQQVEMWAAEGQAQASAVLQVL